MIRDYMLDPPEPKVVGHCTNCGEDIYAGEDAYFIAGKIYCIECVTFAEAEPEEDYWYD